MKRLIILAVSLTATLLPQETRDTPQRRMPDGRTQAEHILQHDYDQSREDVAELLRLAEELKEEFDKNDHHVLSVDALRRVEQIEKLAKKVKTRLKRF
jgi:hypothetical protein